MRAGWVVIVLAGLGVASAGEATTPRDICLEQLQRWMALEVRDPGQEVIRADLKARLEACRADGRLTQQDLARAYGVPPAAQSS